MSSNDYISQYMHLRSIEKEVDKLTFQVYTLGMACKEPELMKLIGEGLQLEQEMKGDK